MESDHKTVRWSKPATQDMREIALGLAQDATVEVAGRFLERVQESEKLLSRTASWWRERDDLGVGIRAVRIKSYPHMLLYRIADESVEIVRVLHGRRDLRALFRKEHYQEGV